MDLDIQKPEDRRKILEDILPEQAAQHHALLRQIFRLEMDYREHDQDLTFYENIYWCGYLLFMVGDPSDVGMLWEGKHVNMDTGVGFDIHSLFGAGYDETVAYLKANRMHDILAELDDYADDLSWLGRWPEYMRDRFYASKP